MALPLFLIGGLGLGAVLLYFLYSLVSVVAAYTAALGGLAVFGLSLRYLDESRLVEVFELDLLNNLGYTLFSVVIGFLSYRFLESILGVVSWILVVVVVLVVLAAALIGPQTLLLYLYAFGDSS